MLALLWQKIYHQQKKNPTEYITQNIETVFAVSPVSDHEILKILGDLKDSAAG